MNENYLTVVGNVVAEPRRAVTTQGVTVVSLRIASNPRFYDREQEQWRDGIANFFTVICWRRLAENVAQSLQKGDPVVVYGKLRLREWEQNDRSGLAVEVDALSVGLDLSRARAGKETMTVPANQREESEPMAASA